MRYNKIIIDYTRSIYFSLPVVAQNIGCTLHGAYMNYYFFGNEYKKILDQYLERSFNSQKTIENYRDELIRKFVRHAVSTTPYYERMFKELGISFRDICGLNDLRKIPILSKDKVQTLGQELVSSGVAMRDRMEINTSGTTGTPLRIYSTARARIEMYAVWGRYYHWHGIQPGSDWCAVFGVRPWVDISQIRPPFWRYNYLGKQIIFSGFHMTQANMKYYVAELREKQPPWIQGFPSLIVLLANYLIENNQDLGYSVKHVTFGAENVFSHQVDAVKKAFGVTPSQHYGLVEGVANFSQCELGKLHVDEDFSAVEFLPQADGTVRIVGTNFGNSAMPLIRYDTSDLVTLDEERCRCGRPGRVVKEIDGRIEDYIVLKDGSKIAQMDSIFKDLATIRAAQFFQNHPGAFTLKIIRGKDYSDYEERELLSRIAQRVGTETEVTLDYVDELQRSQGGKTRLFINEIPKK